MGNMSNSIKVFVDHVGHTIVGEIVSAAGTPQLGVKNPAILIAAPNNNGQLTVQLVPLFFKEFVSPGERDNGAVFNYPADKVVTSDITLDERLVEQYVGLFKVAPKIEEVPTIKLFDEQ